MDLFDAARVRVERARVHAREMTDVWNDYLEPHPFDFDLIRQSDRVLLMRCYQRQPIPAALPAIFGEWLYNLRSALDYIVWASAAHAAGNVPPPNEGGLQYPIYDDETTWQRNLWRLKGLPSHQIEMLKTMQPFRSDSDANFLGWINRLARIDRHRRFTSWTARVAEANPVMAIPSGVRPVLEFGRRTFVGGRSDFARATFSDADSADGVTYNPRVGIDPEIGEWGNSPFWTRVRFSERLTMMMVFVKAEIDVYDFDCTGDVRARETVAEGFASESDARRAAGLFPALRVEQPEPAEWTVVEGRPSTPQRYRGEDYPAHGSSRHRVQSDDSI